MYRAAVNKNYAQFKISQTHEELKRERKRHPRAHSTANYSVSQVLNQLDKNTHTFEFERKRVSL
jgi:hypothetical protein